MSESSEGCAEDILVRVGYLKHQNKFLGLVKTTPNNINFYLL
jgi:hypothetical protein